jgi:hypothetical protein
MFDALEWLAAMPTGAKLSEDWCSQVPNKGEQADFAIVAYGYDG